MKGFEPSNAGATIRCVSRFATSTTRKKYNIKTSGACQVIISAAKAFATIIRPVAGVSQGPAKVITMNMNRRKSAQDSNGLLKKPWFLLAVFAAVILYSSFSGNDLPSMLAGSSVSPTAEVELQAGELGLFFLDVGQGDCLLAELDGETMLVDTGSGDAVMALLDYLQARDIRRIDYLVLTHAHEDHIGNAAEVLRRYEVGRVCLPEQDTDSAVYQEVAELIDKHATPVLEAWAGESFPFAGASCQIVSPSRAYGPDDLNNSSVVLLLTYGQNRFLLTGDAEKKAEQEMLDQGWDISADLLKVGHHGSATSTGADFLAAVSPKLAVISLAADNQYGFPHEEVMKELYAANIIVYRTDQNGSVAAVSNGESITMVTDR